MFDDAGFGHRQLFSQRLIIVDINPLFTAGNEVLPQLTLDRLLGKNDKAAVDVAPVAFEVGVHAGEGAFHYGQ